MLPSIQIPKESLPFLQKIFGPLAEVGELMSEKIRFFRFKSSLKTLEEAKKLVDKHNIDPTQVLLKLLIPLLEKASLEDECSPLINKWASLLASASKDPTEIDFVFAELLSSMGAIEVSLMEEVVSSEVIDRVTETTESGRRVGSNDDNSIALITMGAQEAFFDMVWHEVVAIESEHPGPVGGELLKDPLFKRSISRGAGWVCSFISYTPLTRPSEPEARVWGTNPPVLLRGTSYGIVTSLGLLSREDRTASTSKGIVHIQSFVLTPLGYRFVRACRGDSLASPST